MLRNSLGVLALIAAVSAPFVANAQTYPGSGQQQQPYTRPGVTAPQQFPQGRQGPRQQPEQHRRRHADPFMRAMRNLNLSDQQRQQIMGYMKSSREALRRQIEGALTDQQRAQLRQNLQQQQQQTRSRGFGQSEAGQRQYQPQ